MALAETESSKSRVPRLTGSDARRYGNMKHTTSAGPSGFIDAPIDWVAYAAVQQRLLKCRNSFACNCLEEAANRILSGRSYRHQGSKLAATLEADCRKSTLLRRMQPVFLGLDTQLVPETPESDITYVTDTDLRWAEFTIRAFLSALPPRLVTLLSLEISGASRERIASAMGIAERQYRNLRRDAFQRSQGSNDFMEALSMLRAAGPDGVSIFQATVLTLDVPLDKRVHADNRLGSTPNNPIYFSN